MPDAAYRPGLTAFVLFKDGEAILERFLKSVQPWTEEIIAVDTGAKDRCREIAESYGARLFDLEWPGAFDEAYNFCIERVETEWTLYMDSDEWLNEDSGPLLREAISNDEAYAFNLIRQDHDGQGNFSEMNMLRLWRTHPKLRMVGVIHAHFPVELLADTDVKMGRNLLDSEIRFSHDGFAGPLDPEKVRRNVELLEKELELRPGQPYYEVNLAIDLLNLGEKRGVFLAKRLLDEALSEPGKEPPVPDLSLLLAAALNRVHDLDLASERTERLVRYGWRWFNRLPYVVWAIANLESRRRRPLEEFNALQVLEQMADTGDYARFAGFPGGILGEPMRVRLAQAAERLGQPDIAKRNWEKVLAANPQNEAAKARLGK